MWARETTASSVKCSICWDASFTRPLLRVCYWSSKQQQQEQQQQQPPPHQLCYAAHVHAIRCAESNDLRVRACAVRFTRNLHTCINSGVHTRKAMTQLYDSNSGPVFSIPEFGIGEFLIPGSRDPGGIMGSRRYDIKNRYFWIYGLILLSLRFFVTASQTYSAKLML